MKRILIFLAIIVVTLVLTALSIRHDHEEKVVTFWTLQMGDYSEYMYNIIRKYEKQNPNIHIKWVDVPFSEGEKRTLAAVMTDNPPDLINLNPDFSALLAQKGTLQEIGEEAVTEFHPEIVEALKYNGKIYSIPWYATSAITIYNKELFKKSEVIRLPKTYKEIATVSEKIKKISGAYSFIPTITENDTMIKILNKYGITEAEDYPKAKTIFEMFKDLYEKDLIPKETITFTHREALEQYMAGNVIFFQGGANFLKMIEENAPTIYAQTDVMPQFRGPVGQYDFSVMNFVIPIRSKHQQEALDFCLFLTNAENQIELAKKTNIIATNLKALEDDFYNNKSTLEAKARYISAKQINNVTPILKQRRNQKEINTLVNSAVQSALLNKKSIEEILNNLEKGIQKIEEQ